MAGDDHLKLPHQLVQAAAILIVAGLMFLLHKYWVFTPTKARAET
jgi:hypothetical protein